MFGPKRGIKAGNRATVEFSFGHRSRSVSLPYVGIEACWRRSCGAKFRRPWAPLLSRCCNSRRESLDTCLGLTMRPIRFVWLLPQVLEVQSNFCNLGLHQDGESGLDQSCFHQRPRLVLQDRVPLVSLPRWQYPMKPVCKTGRLPRCHGVDGSVLWLCMMGWPHCIPVKVSVPSPGFL